MMPKQSWKRTSKTKVGAPRGSGGSAVQLGAGEREAKAPAASKSVFQAGAEQGNWVSYKGFILPLLKQSAHYGLFVKNSTNRSWTHSIRPRSQMCALFLILCQRDWGLRSCRRGCKVQSWPWCPTG